VTGPNTRLSWKLLVGVLILVLGNFGSPAYAYQASRDQQNRPHETTVELNGAKATVAFSPDGQGQALIVHAIDEARQEILVQAYGFTNKAILKALVDAHRRGVLVKVILDKSNQSKRYSGATYVSNAGIPVWIDYRPSIAHNKVMIMDRRDVITGSFNFTASAQKRNAENVLYIQNSPRLAHAYVKDWEWRLGLSRVYKRQ
jgi:phosphatidylserine/phosphatidylglycerophosphate/cardiolipin synthase-like enzyme